MKAALTMRGNTQEDNNPAKLANDNALALVNSMLKGDTIASLWSIEDVQSLRSECDIEQISADGEDDGLTWFHCDTHDMDTLDEYSCENEGESTIDDDTARKALACAERNHDAEQGINWDTLRYALEAVENE
jgi:hypothetical protein